LLKIIYQKTQPCTFNLPLQTKKGLKEIAYKTKDFQLWKSKFKIIGNNEKF